MSLRRRRRRMSRRTTNEAGTACSASCCTLRQPASRAAAGRLCLHHTSRHPCLAAYVTVRPSAGAPTLPQPDCTPAGQPRSPSFSHLTQASRSEAPSCPTYSNVSFSPPLFCASRQHLYSVVHHTLPRTHSTHVTREDVCAALFDGTSPAYYLFPPQLLPALLLCFCPKKWHSFLLLPTFSFPVTGKGLCVAEFRLGWGVSGVRTGIRNGSAWSTVHTKWGDGLGNVRQGQPHGGLWASANESGGRRRRSRLRTTSGSIHMQPVCMAAGIERANSPQKKHYEMEPARESSQKRRRGRQ